MKNLKLAIQKWWPSAIAAFWALANFALPSLQKFEMDHPHRFIVAVAVYIIIAHAKRSPLDWSMFGPPVSAPIISKGN